ncbi:hypothetical protein HNP52_000563 [Sphingomonas kyeonggiensis]|uniref:Uncharacterized protein n=1 Tax=Sphingomonas kyeonggiensis TaxID=1268553 RepID=A0A7W7NR71_9SPHN|nr:hypothetical protein [Sphingomonas kyeonggiensis]
MQDRIHEDLHVGEIDFIQINKMTECTVYKQTTSHISYSWCIL